MRGSFTSRAGTSRAGTSRAGPSRAGTSRAGTSRAGTSRAGTSRTGGATLVLALAWLAAVLAGALAPAAAAPPDRSLDPGLAAFLAAGGSLDDICGEGGQGHGAGAGHCDACRLLGPALLPGPTRAHARAAGFAAAAVPGVAAAPVSSSWSDGAPRAPPLRS